MDNLFTNPVSSANTDEKEVTYRFKTLEIKYKPIVIFFPDEEKIRQALLKVHPIFIGADPENYYDILETYTQEPEYDPDGNITNPMYVGAIPAEIEITI